MPDSPRATRPWLSYKERVSRLAQRIVDAQRPIRVLNAIKWDPSVFESFRDSGWRRLPSVTAEDYARIGLGFDPDTKRGEFAAIIHDINNDLAHDGVGDILRHTAEQYVDVVGMLQATEVIKTICRLGDSLAGRLLIVDGLALRFQTFRV